MNSRKATHLTLLAGGNLDQRAAQSALPEPRERAAQIVVAIMYSCCPEECADGRLPERAREAWDHRWWAEGEEVSERAEAFEWLDLILDALAGGEESAPKGDHLARVF